MRRLRALPSALAAGLWFLSATAVAADSEALRDRPTFNLGMAMGVFLAQGGPTGASPEAIVLDEADMDSAEDFEEVDDEDISDLLEEGAIPEDRDPLEDINRPIFSLNLFLDRWILRPVTRVYVETVPEVGRDGVANMLDNFNSPVTLLNDLLQGEMSRAGATFGRFFINSFFGLGGFFDTADAMGLPGHEEDFGQTLGVYGVGGHPFMTLPLIGPTNPRDIVGIGVDIVTDPLTWLAPTDLGRIKTGAQVLSDREQIIDETDALEATSIDFYATVRSLYNQNRAAAIANEDSFRGRDPEGFKKRRRAQMLK